MVWYPLWLKTAVAEDRATQGCDLSATGGPKLAGMAFGSSPSGDCFCSGAFRMEVGALQGESLSLFSSVSGLPLGPSYWRVFSSPPQTFGALCKARFAPGGLEGGFQRSVLKPLFSGGAAFFWRRGGFPSRCAFPPWGERERGKQKNCFF